MIAQLQLDADAMPIWAVFDECALVQYYNGEMSSQEVTKAIWDDFGHDIAVSITVAKD